MATIRKRVNTGSRGKVTYWVVNYSVTDKGKIYRKQLHFRVNPADPQRARLLADQHKSEIERKIARLKLRNGSDADSGPADVEIADWLDAFCEAVRPNCSDVYHKLIIYTLEKFREPLAEQGIVTTGQLSRQHFSDFASAMQDKGNKPKSIHNDLAILKHAVQWGIDEGWLEPNLIRSFPSIRVPKTRRRSLSKEEIEQLIRATDGIELLDPILVALYTGARRGEVVQLLCSDVDLKLGLIRFRAEITKAGEHGDIPIHPRIRPLLEKRALDSGVLLKHASGEPWSRDELSRRFTALTKGKLGWGDVTFHCLRHTFGTQLAASGKVSPFELQRLMRHRSITTSMIYVDLGQQVLPNIDVF